jgi:TRAP-type C4-dicarboxylate transport system substrate-binding protein
LAGEADVFFADQVKLKTDGKVIIKTIHDAKSGLRTREQLKAVSDGRFAMASSFGGALGDENALFLLSTLPLLTPSATDARVLFDAAHTLYEKAFAERGQKLLYASPWPPSGIWSAFAVDSAAALKRPKAPSWCRSPTSIRSFSPASSMLCFPLAMAAPGGSSGASCRISPKYRTRSR